VYNCPSSTAEQFHGDIDKKSSPSGAQNAKYFENFPEADLFSGIFYD